MYSFFKCDGGGEAAGRFNICRRRKSHAEWASYVLGFETGYNTAKPGVRDIFETFGESPSNDVLYAVEARCQKKPDQLFGAALAEFAQYLYEESAGRSRSR